MENVANLGILSILIPLLIIALAIITKDVVVSLLSGIFVGELVIHHYHPLTAIIALLDDFVALFSEAWITKTILFALLVGSIIKLISKSGGVKSFINYISEKQKRIDSPKGALLLAYALGVLIFIESTITALVAGTVAKPLCDKNGVSREKLALVCDSTSAPICSLIPFNAWGALLLGLILTAIEDHIIQGDAVSLLVKSIAFNFYSLVTIVVILLVVLFDINIGPMRHTQPVKYEKEALSASSSQENNSPWLMILPILVLVIMVPIGLYYTGKGDILKGSGSTSVFYAVITTILFMYVYYLLGKYLTHKEYFKSLYEGIGDMIPITLILLLAFLIGNVIKGLGTADYLAHLLQGNIPPMLLPLLVFVVSGITAFSTGTSWGTFSIMMPIALSLGASFGLDIPLMIGATISGGIFGDHVSPISDTTIISSMASGCDHISHVRTQMPYALISAGIASVAYIIAGYFLS
ncbi:MAG TPA: sodium:proton antiporter [Phaeodactylibacter sp.]|nr:sodium:proton antiporter [Phaeodactylibacter sp.]